MVHVFVPVQLRSLTKGQAQVLSKASNVNGAIDDLDRRFPGFRERLVIDDRIRPGLAVGVNGSISSLGLRAPVRDEDEIHFLPAIGGG